MTMFVISLVVLALAAAALTLSLWLLRREPRPVGASEALPRLTRSADFYRPMTRLFTSRDVAFLRDQAGFRPAMSRRLRLERRRVLSLYLQEVRSDFMGLEKACRSLARRSHNWELVSLIYRQRVVFYALLLALRVRCQLETVMFVPVDTGGLLATLTHLERDLRVFADSTDARAAA